MAIIMFAGGVENSYVGRGIPCKTDFERCFFYSHRKLINTYVRIERYRLCVAYGPDNRIFHRPPLITELSEASFGWKSWAIWTEIGKHRGTRRKLNDPKIIVPSGGTKHEHGNDRVRNFIRREKKIDRCFFYRIRDTRVTTITVDKCSLSISGWRFIPRYTMGNRTSPGPWNENNNTVYTLEQ